MAHTCPMGQALSDELHYVRVHSNAFYTNEEPPTKLPNFIQQFIKNFDAGLYPELVADYESVLIALSKCFAKKRKS